MSICSGTVPRMSLGNSSLINALEFQHDNVSSGRIGLAQVGVKKHGNPRDP